MPHRVCSPTRGPGRPIRFPIRRSRLRRPRRRDHGRKSPPASPDITRRMIKGRTRFRSLLSPLPTARGATLFGQSDVSLTMPKASWTEADTCKLAFIHAFTAFRSFASGWTTATAEFFTIKRASGNPGNRITSTLLSSRAKRSLLAAIRNPSWRVQQSAEP